MEHLLPQLCLPYPSVKSALVAAGAAYRLQTRSTVISYQADEQLAASQYHSALNTIRGDLSSLPQGPLPIILTCFLLSLVEMFLQRQENALYHLAGAVQLLKSRLPTGRTFDPDVAFDEDAIGLIFRTIDLQTCSYAISFPPRLNPISIPRTLPKLTDLNTAHKTLVRLTHTCYSFVFECLQIKREQQSPGHCFRENQSRLVAHLCSWLADFEPIVESRLRSKSPEVSLSLEGRHALKLRMTANSALIKVFTALSAFETAYDVHGRIFHQILADGETIIASRKEEHNTIGSGIPDHPRFTLGPGIVEPLFTVAFRYRHPIERRRAIRLLSLSGCEGPWDGVREARIISAMMQHEEAAFMDRSTLHLEDSSASPERLTPFEQDWQAKIPELARIHDWGFSPEVSAHGKSRQATVRFKRHRKTPGNWCRFERMDTPCREDSHCESWSEILEF